MLKLAHLRRAPGWNSGKTQGASIAFAIACTPSGALDGGGAEVGAAACGLTPTYVLRLLRSRWESIFC